MSGIEAFPTGKRVAYSPTGQWDAMTDELGTVAGHSTSGQYVYVDFDGDDLGAKAVAPNLLMPLTDEGEGPDLPTPAATEAELEQAEYEAAVLAMVGLRVIGEPAPRRADTNERPAGDWDDAAKAARDLLGQQHERAAREHGWETGDFVTALLNAMYRADAGNLARLAMVFPAHAMVVHVWKDAPGGYETLHAMAGWKAPER